MGAKTPIMGAKTLTLTLQPRIISTSFLKKKKKIENKKIQHATINTHIYSGIRVIRSVKIPVGLDKWGSLNDQGPGLNAASTH